MEGEKRNSRPLVGLLQPAAAEGLSLPAPKGPPRGAQLRPAQVQSLAAGEGGPWPRPLLSPGPDSLQSPVHPSLHPLPSPSQVSKGQTEKA